ncbi:MAG: short subunit dehydrogenase-like uncharacterized protein [Myxococcota bacterium]|jgi:short subunit dehydrogenase-like uncharacterized protein
MARALDLVVFGATGFTGRLVAEYLSSHAPERLRWAVAGRDPQRLESLRRGLAAEPEIRVADVSDPASLERLAAETRVLVTTVGPYMQFGEPVVAACAAAGTHYLDITGEPAFVSRSIAAYDAIARESGAVIVHCCGFDSIPADLGALFTVHQLPGPGPKTVHGLVQASGSPSGGTWASLLEAMGAPGRPPRKASERSGPRTHTPAVRWEPELNRWAVKLPVIDPVIVRRTARARVELYGEGFTYHHLLAVRGLRHLAGLGVGVGVLGAAAKVPAARRWLKQLRPAGTGPDAEVRSTGWFRLTFVGRSPTHRVVCEVSGGDPGYTETSRMLSECALLLALGEAPAGGVQTPGVAFGMAGVERLQRAGIRFEVLPGG